MEAIRTSARASVAAIGRLIEWPDRPDGDWARGFMGGIFDAEGSFDGSTIRIANTDRRIIDVLSDGLKGLRFRLDRRNAAAKRPKARSLCSGSRRAPGAPALHRRVRSLDFAQARHRGLGGQVCRKPGDRRNRAAGADMRALRHHDRHRGFRRQWRDQPQLLRPPEPPVPEPLGRPRFRNPPLLQEGRCGAPAGGTEPPRPTTAARSTSARTPTPTSRSSASWESRARSSKCWPRAITRSRS